MSRKRSTSEQIIGLLRQAEVWLSHDGRIGAIYRALGVPDDRPASLDTMPAADPA